MVYEEIFKVLEANANPDNAIPMKAYMRNQFEFLGIQSNKLKELNGPFLKISKKHDLNWDFVYQCWDKNYREAQYLAIHYLKKNLNKIDKSNLLNLKKLIITKSWWDTTDAIDKVVGYLVKKYPELEEEMLKWSIDENIWIRRVSIIYQLGFKKNTNTALLEKIIVNNFNSKEFFINKAIGWILRDYSKTNPNWVNDFIKRYYNNLNSLSLREARKYLK